MKRARGLVACCAFVAMTSGQLRSAIGASGIPVAFSFDACPESLTPEVERIARIELHGTSATGVVTQIGLRCNVDDVAITVDDPLTGKRVDRTVTLAGVPLAGRARLLALAIAELARSSWIELEVHPSLVLPLATPVKVSVNQKEEARALAVEARTSPWRGSVSVEGLFLPTVGRPVLGLWLGAQYDITRTLFVEGGIAGWDGVTERSTGAITVRQLGIDPSVGLRLPVVDLALGARFAWASLTGSPSGIGFRGDTTSGFVFGPLLAVSARIVGPLRVWLKSGWLVRNERGVVAGDADVVVGGYWGSLGLGLRMGP